MSLNFNVSPYYDDFDPTKNYHRILFKPGYAVQARELTQSQTILQNQIAQFAGSIFSQNTPITGGKVTTNTKCYYIKLNTTYNGTTIQASSFLNKVITDASGAISAKVIATVEATGTPTTPGDPPTLIVTYNSGVQFADNMLISSIDGSNLNATSIGSTGGSTSTGQSSVVSISQGVFYVVRDWSQSTTINTDGSYTSYPIGNFVNVLPQTIILDKYDNTPSVRVGLMIGESITNYLTDATLLDPAVGASNYQSPGADRYQITLTLATTPITPGVDDTAFIELVRMENGQIIKQVDGTSYSSLDDYFAKRDYETNGDYIVKDFKLTPSKIQNDPASWVLTVGPGVAYVHGYRVENQSPYNITSPRAQTTETIISNSFHADHGSYFITDTLSGIFDYATMPQVDLHCVTAANINSSSANAYNSTLVGSAFLRNLVFQTAANGTNTLGYIFNTYVNDIKTNVLTAKVASATSTTVTINDTTNVFSSSNTSYNGAILSVISGTDSGINDTAKIVTNYVANGTSKTFTVSSPFTITPDATSSFTVSFQTPQVESIVQRANNSTYTLSAKTNVNSLGKVNGVSTGNAILYNSSNPELIFNLGTAYVANVSSSNFYTTKFFRNQSFNAVSQQLSITAPTGLAFASGSGTFYGSTFQSSFLVIDNVSGNILDFSTSANSVTVSGSTATFNSAAYSNLTNVNIVAQMHITNGENYNTIMKTKTMVVGNTYNAGTMTLVSGANSYISTSSGNPSGQTYIPRAVIGSNPIPLYVTDVQGILKIVDLGTKGTVPSTGTSLSSYTDITSNFSWNDGQSDNFYDFSTISLLPGVNPPTGDILVVYEYFLHSGGDGYFSVQSYSDYTSIPSYISKSGTTYNLRDCIDFRPSRTNGQSSYVWEYNNVSSSNHGVMIPTPGSTSYYQNNYSYYLSRKDKLVLSKDGVFSMIYGKPAINSILPTEPKDTLVLANIYLNPYTAMLPGTEDLETPPDISINKVLHKRWAKSDITDLQTQVNNLEYYTSLSALESSAQSLQVPDVNGINRFKNGILVDNFSDFSVCQSNQPGYNANINIRTQQLTPLTHVDNFQLQNPVVLKYGATALNTYKIHSIFGSSTNIYTLPYTTANVVVQQFASNTVSLNPFSITVDQGTLSLVPPADNWFNTIETPAILITDSNLQFTQIGNGPNLLNSGDPYSIVGIASTATSSLTSTAASTYQSQLQSLNALQTNTSATNALTVNNGYINNVQVSPYIRPQQIGIIAKGLLKNTGLSCYFDGVNVDKYMTTPNTIELTGVNGKFIENDIVGFYESNITTFFPIGRVLATYNYPNSSNTRIYLSSLTNPPGTVSTTQLINAKFDTNGNYLSSSANGNVVFANSGIYSAHTSGVISGVGGTFTSGSNTVTNIYKTPTVAVNPASFTPFTDPFHGGQIVDDGHAGFFNNFAVWGDPNNSSTYNSTYTLNFINSGYYVIGTSATSTSGSPSRVYLDGTQILTATSPNSVNQTQVYISAGSHNISWTAVNSYGGSSGFALAIYDTSGNIIWDTVAQTGAVNSAVSQQVNCPGGGSYYLNTNVIQLDTNASSSNSFYTGCSITVRSKYVYSYQYGAIYIPPPPPQSGDGDGTNTTIYNEAVNAYYSNIYSYEKQNDQQVFLSAVDEFTANIVSYNGKTRTATLDTNVNVSMGYNTQYGTISSQYSIQGTVESLAAAIAQGNTIPRMSSNENGDFIATFNVPGSNFFNGQRMFRVDNRNMDSDPSSATTFAQGNFLASSLQSVGLQAASFDSSITNIQPVSYNNLVQTTPQPAGITDPIAQSFIVSKDNYPNGLFLSSVKLFFGFPPGASSQNDLYSLFTSGVTVSVVETLNGVPNGQTLPYSKVTKSASDIIPHVSSAPHYLDPNTFVEFNFPAPVYIEGGVLYAIVIQSSCSEYYVYYAQQNQSAIPSTSRVLPTDPIPSTTSVSSIGAAPYVGALFESQNAITWTADQTKDLMFVINKCVFDTSVTPTVPFITPPGLPFRKLGTQDIQYNMNPNNLSSMNRLFSRNVLMGSMNVTTSDFIPSLTSIDYTYQSTLATDLSLTSSSPIYPGKAGSPTQDNVYFDDGRGPRVLVKSSNNSFIMNATLSSTDNNLSPVISDDYITLYTISSYINNMGISNNVVALQNTGSGYNANTLSVTASLPDYGNDSATFGYTVANGKFSNIFVTHPGSGYLTSPTITISDATTRSGNSNAVATIVGETSPNGGNGFARYYTKSVVLTPGNDSGDLRVYYTAYKPVGSEVFVYYRILNSTDTAKLSDQPWQLMTLVGSNSYSKNRSDYIEYEWAPGTFGSGVANNEIAYTSTSGAVYNTFIQFQLKLVIATSDITKVPVINDLRALALPSGTGI
jgi:Domain of unknown function (DUF4815)